MRLIARGMFLIALVAMCAAQAAAGVTQVAPNANVVGVPSLFASYWTTPPYMLANPCAPGESAITFRLIVRNAGNGALAAINDYKAIWVQDAANPAWAGGASLPAIPVNGSPGVYVPLVGLKDPDQMQGHHVFNVTFEKFGGNTIQIPVDFPGAFCQPVISQAPNAVASAAPHTQGPSKYAVMPPGLVNSKTLVFKADVLGAMVADVFVWTDKSVVDNDYDNKNPIVRDLLYLMIGHSHTVSAWRDQTHTQVAQYTNSIYRGYVHFPVSGIAGQHITSARLRLNGNPTWGNPTCVSQYGGADHLWHPGDLLFISGTALGGSPIVGQDLSLDVTPVVQSWANSPSAVTAFALDDGTPYVIYPMVALADTCTTSFSDAVLDVTYSWSVLQSSGH